MASCGLVVVMNRLLDPKFKYTPAAATDITQTWRKYGWKPIAERKKDEPPTVLRNRPKTTGV
jgi:hypothetical protein